MVLQRAVGCCETARRAVVKLTLEQSAESETRYDGKASRRERLAHRYLEKALVFWQCRRVDMFHINKSGTTEVQAFVS